jgi:hypothetical protein
MHSLAPSELLSRVLYLREVEPEVLINLAGSLPREQFQPNDIILHQGSFPEALYFILDGEIEVEKRNPEGEVEKIATLSAGDSFGEEELVFKRPALLSYRALDKTTLLLWERVELTKFMQDHDAALEDLRFVAQSRRLAQKLRFSWLSEGELIFGLARKHIAILYQMLTLPLLFFIAGIVLGLWGSSSDSSLLIWLGVGAFVASLALGLWQWNDWRNDYYVVTNRRVVWLEKVAVIYDSRREAPLHTILSVSVGTDVGGRMMGFGDVVIRTYTGQVIFKEVGNPQTFAALIEEHWRRTKEKRMTTDREVLQEALDNRLEGDENGEDKSDESMGYVLHDQVDPEVGLDHWGFKIRFEEEGVITYRKHWAALLRNIGISSMLILLLIGLIGARLGGLIEIADTTSSVVCLGLGIIPLILWWVYSYVDWANDIYQITKSQIIDINRKPLAREERKIAPIENILGTEVDRKGILGLMFNFGDVITNVGTTQFIFRQVFDPVGVQQDIVNAQGTLLQKKFETEQQRRRDEMVELLDIYHERVTEEDLPPVEEDDGQNGDS